jgi:hypothetical protein
MNPLVAWMKESRDDSRQKSDDDGPKNTHALFPFPAVQLATERDDFELPRAEARSGRK